MVGASFWAPIHKWLIVSITLKTGCSFLAANHHVHGGIHENFLLWRSFTRCSPIMAYGKDSWKAPMAWRNSKMVCCQWCATFPQWKRCSKWWKFHLVKFQYQWCLWKIGFSNTWDGKIPYFGEIPSTNGISMLQSSILYWRPILPIPNGYLLMKKWDFMVFPQ